MNQVGIRWFQLEELMDESSRNWIVATKRIDELIKFEIRWFQAEEWMIGSSWNPTRRIDECIKLELDDSN
jgi:hypothetical protein